MLEVRDIDVSYGFLQVLWGLNVDVHEGEVVAILGANGAGKSTLMAAMSGVVRPTSGHVTFDGEDVTCLPVRERLKRGLAHVLERQRVFPLLTVHENLRVGAYLPRSRRALNEALEYVYSLFPFLEDRSGQRAGSLSGGEQQMLVIARGLMSRPRMVLLDEPFLGLSPQMVAEITVTIRRLHESGVTIAFIEQDVGKALAIAQRAYVLEAGRLALSGPSEELRRTDAVTKVYMGLAGRT
ncbi:MAG: ABC transporter ATP-binding protein [Solirubrobacteraceae bacterium]